MRTATPNHDKSTLITGSTGTIPIGLKCKLCSTLYNLPCLPPAAFATKNNDVVLTVHHNRCVVIPLLAQSMEVLPAVLASLPRYARFPDLGVEPTARHKGVFDHREGVRLPPWSGK